MYVKILNALNKINANFEIASIGELEKLIKLGVSSDRIICSLPIKTELTVEEMYKYGIRYFVFDSINEYEKLLKFAPKAKKILRVFLNDLFPDTIEFGMKYTDFLLHIKNQSVNLNYVDGVTFYLSDNKNIDKLCSTLQEVENFLLIIGKNKIVNIGGNYRLSEEVNQDFYNRLTLKLDYLREKYNAIIYAEPGRSVVKKAGSLVCKVIYVNKEKNYVYIDAGVPTGISYKPSFITNLTNIDNEICCEYSFFDTTCSHRKLFETELPFSVDINDVLEFSNFGSYSVCKASSFHGWNMPDVYYTDDNTQR